MHAKPVIVISRCLDHGHCRYDGSMIHSDEIENLKKYVDFLPFCPEMAVGLPSPRESLRLVRKEDVNRLVQNKTGMDKTQEMLDYAASLEEQLKCQEVDGFILKGRSPSCGIKDVKIYQSIEKSPPIAKTAKGLFAEAMMQYFPQVIFEEEGRFSNFTIREHFLTFVFTKADFKVTKAMASMKSLVEFHSKNKFLFMLYSQNIATTMGQLVANHRALPIEEVLAKYEIDLLRLLAKQPSRGQVINVLLHVFGYFSKELSTNEKSFFLDHLAAYREGHIPRSTLLSVLYGWVVRFETGYLSVQTLFEPFPKDLIYMTDSGKGL